LGSTTVYEPRSLVESIPLPSSIPIGLVFTLENCGWFWRTFTHHQSAKVGVEDIISISVRGHRDQKDIPSNLRRARMYKEL